MAKITKIPSFFLFGEPPKAVEGRFLHVEDLDDRTRPNNWNIRAHAHADLNHIFYVSAGGGSLSVDTYALPFRAPCLLIVPARAVHALDYQVDTQGAVLTIADSYLRELVRRQPDLARLFDTARVLDVPDASPVPTALAVLARELAWVAPGHEAAVEAQLLIILVDILRAGAGATTGRVPAARPAEVVAQFRELVEQRYRDRWSLPDYASALGVTPARLRAACAQAAGASPIALIKERTMLEAKRALMYSNMTIAEAGYYLGLDDPAYFSRMFTKATGVSPRAFRRQSAIAR